MIITCEKIYNKSNDFNDMKIQHYSMNCYFCAFGKTKFFDPLKKYKISKLRNSSHMAIKYR